MLSLAYEHRRGAGRVYLAVLGGEVPQKPDRKLLNLGHV
jgi:hypothetical protein